VAGAIQQPLMEVAQDDNGPTVPAPKMDEVVCAHNFFRRKGTKPILQATVQALRLPLIRRRMGKNWRSAATISSGVQLATSAYFVEMDPLKINN
jgi:hypothetical protein